MTPLIQYQTCVTFWHYHSEVPLISVTCMRLGRVKLLIHLICRTTFVKLNKRMLHASSSPKELSMSKLIVISSDDECSTPNSPSCPVSHSALNHKHLEGTIPTDSSNAYPSATDFAAAFGVSLRTVSHLTKMGMPKHSIAAAREWRTSLRNYMPSLPEIPKTFFVDVGFTNSPNISPIAVNPASPHHTNESVSKSTEHTFADSPAVFNPIPPPLPYETEEIQTEPADSLQNIARSSAAPSRADIAKALDLSMPRISQLAKIGMPLHSIVAAKEWRIQYQRSSDMAMKGADRTDYSMATAGDARAMQAAILAIKFVLVTQHQQLRRSGDPRVFLLKVCVPLNRYRMWACHPCRCKNQKKSIFFCRN